MLEGNALRRRAGEAESQVERQPTQRSTCLLNHPVQGSLYLVGPSHPATCRPSAGTTWKRSQAHVVGELTQEAGKMTGVLVNFTLGLLGDLRSESLHSSSSDSERKHVLSAYQILSCRWLTTPFLPAPVLALKVHHSGNPSVLSKLGRLATLQALGALSPRAQDSQKAEIVTGIIPFHRHESKVGRMSILGGEISCCHCCKMKCFETHRDLSQSTEQAWCGSCFDLSTL